MRRRTLLGLGAVSATALALTGGTLALLQPGLREGALLAPGRQVFRGASRALLDGSLPADAEALQRALDQLLVRIDGLIAALPPHAQSELSQLLALLASSAGRRALTGIAQPWDTAQVAEIRQGLQSMRVSGLTLRRQAYQALHDIVGAAYVSDPAAWSQLGYPGPVKI
ncbi:MAG: hypothetical protein NDJ19_12615 [Ramlibacter sp.]|nr:hypothetical protein [Ramlibacter sp.]